MTRIPTVKIKSDEVESGFVIINQHEFDENVHEVFEDESTNEGEGEGEGSDEKKTRRRKKE